MAGFAQTTINKLNQVYERWLPKLPAEVNVRNVLIFSVLALLCIGSIMVASASMPYAERMHENAFHYVSKGRYCNAYRSPGWRGYRRCGRAG
mgnify:CR=1 FL=1